VEKDLAIRALWLAYIGKYTQDKIAGFLNISRQKVQRLIAEGIAKDLITVNIDHEIGDLIEIEEQLRATHGLTYCRVVPRMPGNASATTYMESLGLVGSTYLMDLLSGPDKKTIGIGWGRTISHVAKYFHKRVDKSLSHHKFVPLMGSLNSRSAMNPMNLINLFGEKTGAETYFLPAPFMVDSIEDRSILVKQKSVRRVIDLATRADHYFISIGEVGPTSSVLQFGLISKNLQDELLAKGAVADVLGKFIDESGELVDHPINQLSITLDIEVLGKKETTLICSGQEKVRAMRTVLKKRLISGLITDEETAEDLLNQA
jgi:DNA-binding transcriptional regulator LsrR (DeoR family)